MIILTTEAAEHISNTLSSKGIGINISVKNAACSGYSYEVSEITDTKDADHVFTSNNITITTDSVSFQYLNGMVIGFNCDAFQSKLSFHNPLAKNICGCGESFSV